MKYVLIFILFGLAACQQGGADRNLKVNYRELPAFSGTAVNVVVEIPAGTNHKIEFRKDRGDFENDQEDGRDRIIHFLPYPGNYGFIPSTMLDGGKGGDGDPLDILVLAESRPTGSVMEAIPIGALRLRDNSEIDTKIIAVPADTSLRVINATTFRQLLIEYDPARRIIEQWFLNYKGFGAMELIGWEDENYARREIEQWSLRSVR